MAALQRSTIHFLFLFTICQSANILYLMPTASKSHYILMKHLALELANRGHDLYVVTPYLETTYPATYHQLKVDSYPVWDTSFTERPNIFSITEYSFSTYLLMLYRSGFDINKSVFNSTDVQKFLTEDHKIDLVICEIFFNEALYMFAHKYDAPLVLMTTFGNSFKTNYYMNNPLQLSTLFHEHGRSSSPTSLLGTLQNFYYCSFDLFISKFWYFPMQEKQVRKYIRNLREPVPSLEEITSKVSLVLMNSHFSVDSFAAYLPNFVEVAGLHLKKSNRTLPKDLQRTLDVSTDGAIFVSFGTHVEIEKLDKIKLNAFVTVLGQLNQTVLMKWKGIDSPDKHKNLILRDWFPQKEILAHPNIKLFITHGGLISVQESIAAGVPILGIPVFGDQYLNILQTVKDGNGELIEHKYLNTVALRNIINKMLTDKSYTEKAKEMAVRFLDRPMSALDTAVWWVEYVLRHKGVSIIKTHFTKLDTLIECIFVVSLISAVVLVISIVFLKKMKLFKVVPDKMKIQ